MDPGESPAFQYTAIALLTDGQPIAETFTSDVEYFAGDELPLSSARWHVESVEDGGTRPVHGDEKLVRILRCRLM
jgi:hypothetical protein